MAETLEDFLPDDPQLQLGPLQRAMIGWTLVTYSSRADSLG